MPPKKNKGTKKKGNKNLAQIEDKIINQIYQVIDTIFDNISDTTPETQNIDVSNQDNQISETSSDLDNQTQNVTMNITNNDIPLPENGNRLQNNQNINPSSVVNETQDDNINLTGGSQLFPGSIITPDSHMARINTHERQINRQLRQQRYQQLMNSRRNAMRQRNRSINPLLSTSLRNNSINSNRQSLPMQAPRPQITQPSRYQTPASQSTSVPSIPSQSITSHRSNFSQPSVSNPSNVARAA